jgi:hypothetical protein
MVPHAWILLFYALTILGQTQKRDQVVGLLRLPDVFGESACAPFTPKDVNLYATPSLQARAVGTIRVVNPPREPNREDCTELRVIVRHSNSNSDEELPTNESDYEEKAAIVYERSGQWFRIALQNGSAWIRRDNAGGFLRYPDLVATGERLTYLRAGWNGMLWTDPSNQQSVKAPAAWQDLGTTEIPVTVVSTRTIRGGVWLKLRFELESCGQSLGNVPPLEGWLPAYWSSGETAVWFYSRGC